jgi:hypothetical protein
MSEASLLGKERYGSDFKIGSLHLRANTMTYPAHIYTKRGLWYIRSKYQFESKAEKDDLKSITNQVMLLRSKLPSHFTTIEFTQTWNNDTTFKLVEDGRARIL